MIWIYRKVSNFKFIDNSNRLLISYLLIRQKFELIDYSNPPYILIIQIYHTF